MKALLSTSIVFLSFCSITMAQINRGNFMLGGNISASHNVSKISSSSSKTTVNSISNNATVAFFLAKNFCLGLGTPYEVQYTNYSGPDAYKTTTKTYGIKPFVRYYIPVSSNLFILTEGVGIITETVYHQEFNLLAQPYKNKSSGGNLGFGLGTGLAFKLNNHAILELEGNYQYTKSSIKAENASESIKSTANKLFVSIGFNFLLPGRQE